MEPYGIETAYGAGGEMWAMAGKLHIGRAAPTGAVRSRQEKAHGNEESEESQQAGGKENGKEATFGSDHVE
jgi:hypothetical protein